MSLLFLAWLLPVCLAGALLIIATFVQPRILTEAAVGLLIASLPFAAATPFTPATKTVVIILQLMLLLLAGRLLFGRLDKAFVNPSTRLHVYVIFGAFVAIYGGWLVAGQFPGILGDYGWRLIVLLAVAFGVQTLFLRQLLWSFKHYRIKLLGTKRTLRELPTVSVCIPARNEDHALEDCLTTVLASTYPKLEVIVLDDCSQDKTSQIIRSFAHDGVRFVQGEVPADGWLGKNQAMQTLADQATGDFILFMDVDTSLSTTSIATLVNYTLDEKLEMVAVMPQNRLGALPGAIFGTLRRFWQMVMPITKRRVSVAEEAWLINAKTFKKLGSFRSVAHKIVPETTFARRLFGMNTYRFIAGNSELGITTAKKWQSETESALRILYPTYRRQPLVALGAVVFIGIVIPLPMVLVVWFVLHGQYGLFFTFALIVTLLAALNFALVLRRSHPRVWFLVLVALPFVAAQEIVLIFVSMFNYEFGDVNWKGRNVCYPVISSGRNRSEGSALRQPDHS